MLPLTAAFETVAQMFSTNSFNEQEAKVSLGEFPLLRDLTCGIWGFRGNWDWSRGKWGSLNPLGSVQRKLGSV